MSDKLPERIWLDRSDLHAVIDACDVFLRVNSPNSEDFAGYIEYIRADFAAAPPREVVVDEALIDKAGRAFGKANGLSWDEKSMRAALAAALTSDHPDDTGPFVCECCDATHPGDSEVARHAKWCFTFDGWLCPRHAALTHPQGENGDGT